MLWVGIDEAGYGPNIGPLVMTAVVAEGPDDRKPDPWADLPAAVCRAGGPAGKLWIDDSKAVHAAGKGLERLEAATLAALTATGSPPPDSLLGLLGALGAGTADDCGLGRWLVEDIPLPRPETAAALGPLLDARPFDGAPWRIVAIRSAVCDAGRFNAGLRASGSKAVVHFGEFAGLLRWVAGLGGDARVRGDKHGGRTFYYAPLADAFPDAWIERGEEAPARSRYALRTDSGRVELELTPRADADDGLVALASMVSKAVRELWMGAFNAFWAARLPGLRPTAGYPVDARRFRAAIEPECRRLGLEPDDWWRAK